MSNPSSSKPPIARQPSYLSVGSRRAMASFENLVALANYEERLKEARRVVWRDRGEKPVELEDIWECAEHGSRGALRAGGIGFAIRSGVNLILLLARIKKVPRHYRFALIRHALFGPDSFRFAAMLGSFVGLYKFILNSLPILLPEPQPRHFSHSRIRSELRAQLLNSNLSSSSRPSNTPFDEDLEEGVTDEKLLSERHGRLSASGEAHQVWVRKKTRRWYAIFAGAFAGAIAISFERKDHRVGIAQQMFVRGLQGTYNAFSQKHGISIPHGDVMVFALCCAQIMYSFILRPDTLPKSYVSWIQSACKAPKAAVSMNRDLVRDGKFKVADIDTLLASRNVTAFNESSLLARRRQATLPIPDYGPHFGPCYAVHPWIDSCRLVPIDRFWVVFKWILPIYGVLHYVPMLLFKRGRLLKDPLRMFLRSGWGSIRSSAFLGVFVIIYQTFFCFKSNMYEYLTYLRNLPSTSKSPLPAHLSLLSYLAKLLPQSMVDLWISKFAYWLPGLLCGLSLFVEEKKRREELAMYVLPKGLESAWSMARGKGYVFGTGNYGDLILTAAGMGMVMNTYQNDPHHLSGLVRRILYQFVGPN
ncbi:hypothetical protein C8Q75DRAFT_727422 [Abortiporus biennis]|nr:hypothetical protein C8Q75DRAFT_727422 [Abortiporus biennis]